VSSSSALEGEETKLFNKIPCISCPASLNKESSFHEGLDTTGDEKQAFHGLGAIIFSSASVRYIDSASFNCWRSLHFRSVASIKSPMPKPSSTKDQPA